MSLPVKQLLSEEQLRAGVTRLSREISQHAQGRPLMIVGVLTGSVVLLADLIRLLDIPLRVGLVQASSYRGTATTPGELTINAELLPDVRGQDVVVIDDIFDTGHTLVGIMAQLESLGARSVRSAVLLRKAERCEVDLAPDYVGFDIPNLFVVGYGLDYNDHYRNLPYVATLDEDEL